MRYNQKAEIYTCTPVPNGYGGYVKDIKLFGIVDVLITPLHYDFRYIRNMQYTVLTCKLFTKTPLPEPIDHVIVDGVKYSVGLHNDLGKIHMLALEIDGRTDG